MPLSEKEPIVRDGIVYDLNTADVAALTGYNAHYVRVITRQKRLRHVRDILQYKYNREQVLEDIDRWRNRLNDEREDFDTRQSTGSAVEPASVPVGEEDDDGDVDIFAGL